MQQISFITNTAKNNLEYTKLLLQSLKQNLDSQDHQIIVFIDSDNENTFEWLMSMKNVFTDLTIIRNTLDIPIGYQRNKTLLTEYAKHDIVSYLQSDMVIGPHYDTEILKHVKRGRILSATRVEPPLHGMSPVTVTRNFGLHPEEFNMEAWNTFSNSVKRDELISYFFAPMTYYKEDWLRLGGYDTVFRRAREDSDLVQRCLHANIELVQTFSANVYHFTCVSSRGKDWFDNTNQEAQSRVRLQNLADSVEMKRFIRKWGNFNHGETQLFKLDIDVVVRNYTLDMIDSVEPFFTRVWVSSEHDKRELLRRYDSHHTIANTLLGATDETWERYRHLYRTDDFESIINVGVPETFHIKVELDFSNPHGNSQFISSIPYLYDLLGTSETGVYQLDGVTITVDSVYVLPTKTYAQNPTFDYSVLTIH